MRAATVLLIGLALTASACKAQPPAQDAAATTVPAVQHYTVRIVRTYPHDSQAFTEGLFYDGGALYESTGHNGQSFIRKVDLATGKPLRSVSISSAFFGEGIAPWKGSIVSLTWQTGTGFVWNQSDFRMQKSFSYAGEGWGMTRNDKNLIMSDGTPTLKFLDPDSLTVTSTLNVTMAGQPVRNVNELEWVDGKILANVWMTDQIVRIDPATGKVDGVIDISSLPDVAQSEKDQDAVPNGIAYDPVGHRLFVTGKLWPHLYQVELVPAE